MLVEPAQLVASWPWAVTLVAVGGRTLLAGRRRNELNEALHELRRPLQALVLAAPEAGRAIESSTQMAAIALEQLDREINGERTAAAVRAPVAIRPLLEAAVGRWQRRAVLAGGSIRLCSTPRDAILRGDCGEIARALDNLIVNALEHGGPEVVVAAEQEAGGLRVSVLDSGGGQGSRQGGRMGLRARLGGRRRRGHGLRVVRRVAGAHGGSFLLRRSRAGTEATLHLPLLGGEPT